ncbi:MAG TPA: ABC transporter permease, partial [Bryobacteraceae bacterium]
MSPGEQHRALLTAISPDYFRVMQIPLLRGRQITTNDVERSPWVIVINETMAKKYWGKRNPIGQMITLDTQGMQGEERPREVVGVVGDVRQFRLGMNASPEVYLPYLQQVRHFRPGATETRLHKSVVLRT